MSKMVLCVKFLIHPVFFLTRDGVCVVPVGIEFVESGGGVTVTVGLQYTSGYCRSGHHLLVMLGGALEWLPQV